jgi:hypothetical protein
MPATHHRSQIRPFPHEGPSGLGELEGAIDARLPRVHAASSRLPSSRGRLLRGVSLSGQEERVSATKAKSRLFVDDVLEGVRTQFDLPRHQDPRTVSVASVPLGQRLLRALQDFHNNNEGSVNADKLLQGTRLAVGSVLRVLTGFEFIGPQVMIQQTWKRGECEAHLGKLGAILPREPSANADPKTLSQERGKNVRAVMGAIRAIDRDRLEKHLSKATLRGVTFAPEPLKLAVLVFEKLLGSAQDPFPSQQIKELQHAINNGEKRLFVIENNTYRMVVDTRGDSASAASSKWKSFCFKVGELLGRHAHGGYPSSLRVSRKDRTDLPGVYQLNYVRVATELGMLAAAGVLSVATPPLMGSFDMAAKLALVGIVACSAISTNGWFQDRWPRQKAHSPEEPQKNGED